MATAAAPIAAMMMCASSWAGTYDVPACDAAAGANGSWTTSETIYTTAYVQCPSNGDPLRGLVARNAVQPGLSSGNLAAALQFTAPAGTSIVGIRATGDFYAADSTWGAALGTGSQVLRGCGVGSLPGCARAISDEWVDVPRANALLIAVNCPGTNCSLEGSDAAHNYLRARARLTSAVVRIEDNGAPAVASARGELWTDGWKRGTASVSFDASDASGIRQTALLVDGETVASRGHACDATLPAPCAQGGDSLAFSTNSLKDGSHSAVIQAVDSAGNPSTLTRTVLVDNTPPGSPQELKNEGGDGWHPANAFSVTWTNPKVDGAPVGGAVWQICPVGNAGACVDGEMAGDRITALRDLKVRGAGDFELRLRLRDAAGNISDANSPAVARLRLDDEAPAVVFLPRDPADPATVRMRATDAVSGIASGAVEIKPLGSETWTSVPAQLADGQLVASLPDETLADGAYDLRGRAVDQAGNERSTTTLEGGEPMTVTLPVRAKTRLTGGLARAVRRKGKRVTVLASSVRAGFSRRVRLRGRLVDASGQPMAGTGVQVLERTALPGRPWRQLRTLTTGKGGTWSFRAAAKRPSRTVRFRYPGTPTVRPSQIDVALKVAARATIRPSSRIVRLGSSVRFSGVLLGGHIPASGKVLQLQAKVNGRWQVFANPRTNSRGRWSRLYRFIGRYRSATFQFRVRVPRDPAYPFAAGVSPATRVLVRGP
ncbi:hypothetical protein DSM112329_00783 [Paraconexibacter sp. AEG42_29]|uniref:Ig-like domain-containing protein n=1 Tax=Paraconexibacter sp. AEG42_29 TaxID=2997339 RepID=A0AAU7AQN8_9ACTN